MSRVVMLAPDPARYRAGGPWVTIANWTEALDRAFGDVAVVTPGGTFDAEAVRALAWSRTGASMPSKQRSAALKSAETAVKDVRSFRHARRFAHDAAGLMPTGEKPAFIWQYHHLFQTAGFRVAADLHVPVALFVDAPVVWEARRWGVRRPGWDHLLERRGERPQLRAADVVCCVTSEVADAVVEIGAPRDRVIVTPCTADPERFDQAGDDVRTELGLEDAIVVGWVGSFRPFHDLDLLLDAFAEAQRREPRLALLLVGDGPRRQACVDDAEARGLEHVVSVGQIPHEEVARYVRTMDIAVVPGRGANFHYSPLKLKEYLATGRAVVAPRVGEIARTIHDGEDGVLYEPGDAAGFAAAINRLAADDALRAVMGDRGRRSVTEGAGMHGQVAAVAQHLGLTGLLDPSYALEGTA